MSEQYANRSIRIDKSVVGSAIVSGDGNTVYVIHQATEQQDEVAPSQKKAEIGLNPYKGLAAFKERDADRYFGREAQVARLMERFQALYNQSSLPRFLPILGPSGCGKSSLARAGFIPALAQQPLPGKDKVRVAVLVPGSHPLEALAGVLAKAVTNDPLPVEKTEEFERVLNKRNDEGEYEGLRRIASLIPGIQDSPLVILVDQFEEIYSLRKDRNNPKEQSQQQVFVNTLLHAAQDPTGNVSVVITLRSDFLGETQRHKGLNQVIGSDQSLIVPAMTEYELRKAVAEPAKQAGHPLDEFTIDRLVNDTEGREGALPLLQFALTRIWEGLKEGKEPAITYREMNGVGGALAGKAQEIYASLEARKQEIVRRVFIGLVQLGEGTRDTRRRVEINSLVSMKDSYADVEQVIYAFAAPGARLISLSSLDGHEIAEVTHEALFDHWQLLNDWLDSSRDDIRFHRRLEEAAKIWDQNKRAEGGLWRPPDLDLLRDFHQRAAQEMTALETSFWQRSNLAEQHRKRNKRLLTSGLVLGLLVTTLSAVVAFIALRASNRNRLEAERNNVNSLTQTAAALIASGDPCEAGIFALQAAQKFQQVQSSNSETRNIIQERLLNPWLLWNTELTCLANHGDTVNEVHFSPDGQTVVTASDDGTAKLWHSNGTLITTLKDHSDAVNKVRFSPDGRTLATASNDGTAKLWQRDGTLITTLEGHSRAVNDLRFSPDGETLATASADGTAKLWQRDGTLINTFKGKTPWLDDVRFSPDGKTLVTVGGESRLWQSNGNFITTLNDHNYRENINEVRFSSDGQTLATASEDGTVKLLQSDGTFVTTLEGVTTWLHDLRFSPDGETLATASADGIVQLWQRDGTLIATLKGHNKWVNKVRFSPDGQTLATASADGTAKLWQRDGTLINTFKGHTTWVQDVRFSPDGKTLATAGADGTAKLWQHDKALITTLKSLENKYSGVRFSPDGNILATASADGTAKLWERDGTLITTLKGHSDTVNEVRFSSDGNILATASNDGTAKLWERDGTLITTLKGHSDTVNRVRFGFDGNILATASNDGTAKLWERDGTLITTLKGHSGVVNEVRFNLNSKTLSTASNDGTAMIWGRDGTLITTLKGHSDTINTVAFSPDGETLATASNDDTAKLWRRDGTLINTLEGHINNVSDIRFSPDGRSLVTLSDDGTARLWQHDGTLITTLKGHANLISTVIFSPDGETLATSSLDGTAKLWQRDGTLITTLTGHTTWLHDVSFSPDGKTLATSGDDGVKLWPWDLDTLMAYTCQQVGGYLRSNPDISPEDRTICD